MKCPNCGAEAKGKFCEYCGSEMPKEKTTINITNNYYVGTEKPQNGKSQSTANSQVKGSKKHTWLWALGWICIFPVPLTILMLRKKNMKPAVKYGIIAAAWLLFFVIGMSGNSKTDVPSQTESVGITETTDALPTDNTITEQPTDSTFTNDTTTEDVVLSYAEDQVVNRFISEFNAQSAFEITDISKGNIRTKYFGSAYGRYLEMINANDAGAEAFCLTINGGQEDSEKQSMYEVFREAVKVLDSSITDDMIDAAISEFNNKDVLIEGYVLSDCITITFVPIKELSYGKTSCRIDINASNYK